MRTRITLTTLALLTSVLLSACGGSDGEAAAPAPTPSNEVPSDAAASPEAFTAWTQAQRASESGEPYSMGSLVNAPSSETLEPASLN
jgi:hypothetical protein